MTVYRIWRGSTMICEVLLNGDQTLVIERAKPGDAEDIVGVDADGRIVTWDDEGNATTIEPKGAA